MQEERNEQVKFMMPFMKKTLSIFVVLIMFMYSHCLAKQIYDNTGRISFETSDEWFYASGEDDIATYHLHSIALDKDTIISFKQSKYVMKYPSMKVMPMEDKSIIRDSILQYHINALQSLGYSVTINKPECLEDSIVAGFTVKKDFSSCYIVVEYFIKDYVCYSLCAMCTDKTKDALLEVIGSIRIDGKPLSQWRDRE